MAIQVINDPNRTFGSSLANSLGSGLSSGLQSLAQLGIEDLLARKQQQRQLALQNQQRQIESQALQGLGLPRSLADTVSMIPDRDLKMNILQNIGMGGSMSDQNTSPQSLFNMPEQNAPTGLQYKSDINPVAVNRPNKTEVSDNIFIPRSQKLKERKQTYEEAIKGRELRNREAQQSFDNSLSTRKQDFTEKNSREARALEEKLANAKSEREREKFQKQLDFAKAKEDRRATEFDKKLQHDLDVFNRKQEVSNEKAAAKELELGHKETKDYYDQTLAAAEAAKFADRRLDQMEKLINEGSLPVASMYKIFKNLEEKYTPTEAAKAGGLVGGGAGFLLGGPIGAAAGAAIGGGVGALISPVATMLRYGQRGISPDTQEFEKLSAEFIRDVKSIFGSRITNLDLETFLKSIPTLENTDFGKKAIIKNMRIFNKGKEARVKVMNDIIKENGGKRPFDLHAQVEERVAPMLDRISKQFNAGI